MQFIKKVVHFRIQGKMGYETTEEVLKGIKRARFHNPPFVAISINSEGGSLVHAKTISQAIFNYANRNGAPVFCFAEDFVMNSALQLLTSGNKCYAHKFSLLTDFGYSISQLGLKDFVANWQIEKKYIHSGENKVKLNRFEDLKESDVKWVNSMLKHREQVLKNLIQEQRAQRIIDKKTTQAQIDNAFSQMFIKGHEAVELGLLDDIEEFDHLLEHRYHGVKVFEAMENKLEDWDFKYGAQRLQQFIW